MSIEFKLPELGENIEGGDVVSILVAEGETIEGNQGVFEVETDKAVIEIPCPHAGTVATIHVKNGDAIKVGQLLLTVDGLAAAEAPEPAAAETPAEQTPVPTPAATPAPQPAQPTVAVGDGPIPAGPAARRVARALGVEIAAVPGTGMRGRITPEDVQAAASSGPSAASIATRTGVLDAVVPPGEPGRDNHGVVRTERMSKIRRTIAAQMVKSKSTAPHVTNFDDADVTDLEKLRKGVPKGHIGPDLKLTSMPFVMKAVAIALKHHPVVNAMIDDENEQFVYKEYVNVGVAVDTPRGLIVPVMRDVDRMTIPEIGRELAGMAGRARAGDFGIEELRGGSFTISNLGAVGGTYSTPVINHPEVAILLLGRSRWMPVVRDGEIVQRFMMPLSLSYDHRLVDGAAAARFLNEVIELLQSPAMLLLTG